MPCNAIAQVRATLSINVDDLLGVNEDLIDGFALALSEVLGRQYTAWAASGSIFVRDVTKATIYMQLYSDSIIVRSESVRSRINYVVEKTEEALRTVAYGKTVATIFETTNVIAADPIFDGTGIEFQVEIA